MAPCEICTPHAGLQTLRHDPRLRIARPTSVTPSRLNHRATPDKPVTTLCRANPFFGRPCTASLCKMAFCNGDLAGSHPCGNWEPAGSTVAAARAKTL